MTEGQALDKIIEEYLDAKAVEENAAEEVEGLRKKIIDLVEKRGAVPARAVKTKALRGVQWEARVSRPQEITVDTGAALTLRRKCRGVSGLWGRLFRRVETFVLADGAEKTVNTARLPKLAPRNLRALFARAIKIRELSPQLEIRGVENGEKAA